MDHTRYTPAQTKASQPWITPGIRQHRLRPANHGSHQVYASTDQGQPTMDHTRYTPSHQQAGQKYRKMKKTGSAELREEVKILRHTIQRQIRRSYWKYLNSVFTEEENAHQAGNKRFWSYIKNQRSSNLGVAPLKKDGRLTSNLKEQCRVTE